MKMKSLLAAILGLALALSALTGVAGAGKPDDPGKSEDAPGQVKKAEEAPPATPASQGKSASAPGQMKTEKAANPAKGKSAQAKAKVAAKPQQEPNKGRSAEAHHHVIICHATGSATNPFVVINIPMTAWTEAHDVHQDGRDFILKDPASRPGSKDGFDKSDCGQAAQQSAAKVEEQKKVELLACPPVTTFVVTTTGQVVLHHAGPTKVVEISPSEKSSHYQNKHPDDLKTVTETRTVVTQGECKEQEQQQVLAAEQPKAAEQLQVAEQPPAAQEEQGGVLGAQAVVRQPPAQQGQGGVLGEIGSVASSELPFTGIQLWIVLLAGIGLFAAGLGARRAMG